MKLQDTDITCALITARPSSSLSTLRTRLPLERALEHTHDPPYPDLPRPRVLPSRFALGPEARDTKLCEPRNLPRLEAVKAG